MQENRTPFQEAVYESESAVVSLFVNKYKTDPKQYDQVTKEIIPGAKQQL